jgi:hypothetical protein
MLIDPVKTSWRMKDRLVESLPLLLVGAILLVFYFTRAEGPAVQDFPMLGRTQAATTATPAPLERTPVSTPTVTTAGVQATLCNPARPLFIGRMAALKLALGASMGDAVECERAVDDNGNTQQQTTTGLAYFRKEANAASFTTGWDHWALLVGRDLVYWSGDAVDPPATAKIVNHY